MWLSCGYNGFVCAAVNDRAYIANKAASIEVTPFTPKTGVVIHTTDAEAQAAGGMEAGEGGREGGREHTHMHTHT